MSAAPADDHALDPNPIPVAEATHLLEVVRSEQSRRIVEVLWNRGSSPVERERPGREIHIDVPG